MMSIADMQQKYQQQGYVAIPDFFDAQELAALQNEVARLFDAGHQHNVATDGDGETLSSTMQNLQLIPVAPHSPLIRALPFADKVKQVVTSLLQGSVRLRLDQIFMKPAGNGAGTGWHQDNGYFKEAQGAQAMQGLGMWIAIHDANEANGCMRFIPAVHDQVLEHRRDGGSNHHVTCIDAIDESTAEVMAVPAGGVLFFNYGVPHCTGPNQTDKDRAGLALHFQTIEVPSQGAARIKRPWISGPEACGGQDCYEEDQTGRWEQMVAGQEAAAPS